MNKTWGKISRFMFKINAEPSYSLISWIVVAIFCLFAIGLILFSISIAG
jgi:hypothetical protein